MAILDIETIDRETIEEQSKGVVEAEKQCRIALSADAPRAVDLNWHPGRGGHLSIIKLEPGKSVVQPLSKAQAWFGPFAVPLEYKNTTDERRKEALRQFWATEKARYLNRYDYERPTSVSKGGYEPIGPHRSPDVTVTIIESDGTEHEPIRLYQLYKIGEFDPIKDTFGPKESIEEIKAKYEAELHSVSERYEREAIELRRQMAEVLGMVKGSMTAHGASK